MVDSPKLCAEWMAALNNNQNTAMLGPIGEDGLWRDKDGNVVQSSGGLGGHSDANFSYAIADDELLVQVGQ